MDTNLGRGNRITLVVDRGGGASQIIDLVYLQIDREGYLVSYDFEIGIFQKRENTAPVSCIKIIDTDNTIMFL